MKNFMLSLIILISLNTDLFAAADTTGVTFLADGNINEVTPEKFTTDKDSRIQFIIENNSTDLYIAMRVPDREEEKKIEQMGMQLYIDINGKHKQNVGIGFPVKLENIRGDVEGARLVLKIESTMKLFGFNGIENKIMTLDEPGRIKLGFDWDKDDILTIEYIIPIELLSENAIELTQKPISVGWKINGTDDIPAPTKVNSTSLGGLPNNGITNASKSMQSGNIGNDSMKEQMIWSKYSIHL